MRVTKIELKNWGPHEKKVLDLDAPVAAILGPNAAGKTNILEALNFAFTGLLSRNQDSYVRRVNIPEEGGEDVEPVKPPTNGSVKVWFKQHGMEGVIFRQVGSSPRRKLEWDGKAYTSLAQVEETLREVLECERRAISMAVFLTQGKIGAFLFETPAEREKLFAQLCLVDHLPRVADIIDQKLLDTRRLVTEYGTTLDEIEEQLRDALAQAEVATTKFNEAKDMTESLQWLNKYSKIQEEILEKRVSIQTLVGELSRAQERFNALEKPEGLTRDDFEGLTKVCDELAERRTRLNKLDSDLEAARIAHSRISQMNDGIVEGEQAVTGILSLDSDISRLKSEIEAFDKAQGLRSMRDALQSKVTADKDAKLTTEKGLADATDELKSVDEELAEVDQSKLGVDRVRLEVLQSVVDLSLIHI